MDIRNKKIIVTGGAKGIGKDLVEKLLKEGAIVGVFDVDAKALDAMKKLNPDLFCKICDVSDHEKVTAAVDEFYKEFKEIDVLVNNAGLIYNSPLINLTVGEVKKHEIQMWRKVIDTDLNSVFYVSSSVAQKMVLNRTKGVIVNISSICAAGNPGQGAYSAAKAGINALTAAWAKELGPIGIRVVAVSPGYIETETMKKSMSENILKELKRRIPIRRFGKTEEIVDGILFAIKNDLFNGKVLELDGGLVIGS